MTYEDSIIQNWLASGVDPDLIRLNPEVVDRQVEQELRAWIDSFISSFRQSQLKTTLQERIWFRRCPSIVWNSSRSLSGLSILLKPDSEKDFKFLVSKRKQVAYRVRKLDPEVKLFFLFEPGGREALTTVLPTGELVLSRAGGAR